MPAWIKARAERLEPEMRKTYGPEKAQQVAWAVSTQQAHATGKSPKKWKGKPFGTPEAKREAKDKYDEPSKMQKSAVVAPQIDAPMTLTETAQPAAPVAAPTTPAPVVESPYFSTELPAPAPGAPTPYYSQASPGFTPNFTATPPPVGAAAPTQPPPPPAAPPPEAPVTRIPVSTTSRPIAPAKTEEVKAAQSLPDVQDLPGIREGIDWAKEKAKKAGHTLLRDVVESTGGQWIEGTPTMYHQGELGKVAAKKDDYREDMSPEMLEALRAHYGVRGRDIAGRAAGGALGSGLLTGVAAGIGSKGDPGAFLGGAAGGAALGGLYNLGEAAYDKAKVERALRRGELPDFSPSLTREMLLPALMAGGASGLITKGVTDSGDLAMRNALIGGGITGGIGLLRYLAAKGQQAEENRENAEEDAVALDNPKYGSLLQTIFPAVKAPRRRDFEKAASVLSTLFEKVTGKKNKKSYEYSATRPSEGQMGLGPPVSSGMGITQMGSLRAKTAEAAVVDTGMGPTVVPAAVPAAIPPVITPEARTMDVISLMQSHPELFAGPAFASPGIPGGFATPTVPGDPTGQAMLGEQLGAAQGGVEPPRPTPGPGREAPALIPVPQMTEDTPITNTVVPQAMPLPATSIAPSVTGAPAVQGQPKLPSASMPKAQPPVAPPGKAQQPAVPKTPPKPAPVGGAPTQQPQGRVGTAALDPYLQHLAVLRNTVRAPMPWEIIKQAEDDLDSAVAQFLLENQDPSDDVLHQWAMDNGYDKEEVEEAIYRLASKFVQFSEDGRAREKDVSQEDVSSEQSDMGVKVEKEHTPDEDTARRIARDHLAEIPDYYTRLKKMEDEAGIKEGRALAGESALTYLKGILGKKFGALSSEELATHLGRLARGEPLTISLPTAEAAGWDMLTKSYGARGAGKPFRYRGPESVAERTTTMFPIKKRITEVTKESASGLVPLMPHFLAGVDSLMKEAQAQEVGGSTESWVNAARRLQDLLPKTVR